MAQINFRKQWKLEHSEDELDYKTPFNPILLYITIVLLAISVYGIAWDSSQRAGLYFGIPFMIFCYLYHYLRFKNGKEALYEHLKIIWKINPPHSSWSSRNRDGSPGV